MTAEVLFLQGINMYKIRALISSILVFLATFIIRYFFLQYTGPASAGDFLGALVLARNVLKGVDPYTGVNFVPYPLPAGLIALPFAPLQDRLAGILFFSLTAAILAGAVIWKTGQLWRLLLLFSLPFVVSMKWTQWSSLITAAWYIPILAPLMLIVKPQVALPVFINRWAGYLGYLVAAVVLVVSFIISPGWPIHWLSLTRGYQYAIPLLLPGGFLLALSLLNISNKRARLLMVMAVLPVRATYDLVPLFIIPETPLQMAVLVLVSWLAPVNVWYLVALIYILAAINLHKGKMNIYLFWERFKGCTKRSGRGRININHP